MKSCIWLLLILYRTRLVYFSLNNQLSRRRVFVLLNRKCRWILKADYITVIEKSSMWPWGVVRGLTELCAKFVVRFASVDAFCALWLVNVLQTLGGALSWITYHRTTVGRREICVSTLWLRNKETLLVIIKYILLPVCKFMWFLLTI